MSNIRIWPIIFWVLKSWTLASIFIPPWEKLNNMLPITYYFAKQSKSRMENKDYGLLGVILIRHKGRD